MIIYNVTIKVETAIAADWLQWLKEEHIPELIDTRCFSHATILRLLETDDLEGPTYAVQYHAENLEAYQRYIQQYASGMRQKAFDKWGNRFIAFRSVMELVH